MKSDKTKNYLIQYIGGGLIQCKWSDPMSWTNYNYKDEKDTLWKKWDTLLGIIASPQLN